MHDKKFQFQRRGLIYVISAPSGGGKSVVGGEILARMPELVYSVSVTSRPPRADEVEGRDYQFVSREAFERMIGEEVFYEWAEVHGHYYGTREDTVLEALERGRDVIMDIDVQGGMAVKWRSADAVLLFLMPPSFKVLEQRLRDRRSEGEEQIRLRLGNALREIEYWRLYDYILINDKLDDTVADACHILQAERQRTRRMKLLEQGGR
jgi:guanylate kinase